MENMLFLKECMEKFPAMAMGIMQATADVGLDPESVYRW